MSEELEPQVHESPKLDEMVKAYIAIRTARENLYRQYKTKDTELGSELSQLEQVMLDECNALNVESVRTNMGTITRTVKEQFSCNNWDEFKQYVLENNALELLQQRIHNGNFAEHMANHEGQGLPPGISSIREFSVVVRKPTSK
jgi:DnaJ-domain-containing protein 1